MIFNQTALFIIWIALLFILSRRSIQELFTFVAAFTKNTGFINGLMALLFFPGTVIHELSHFLMATVLLLRVREVSVFPRWNGREIKLGYVLYEKKDFLRGVIVGIAPLIVGVLLFFLLAQLRFSQSLLVQVGIAYAMFVLSTTMFSSPQDLVDAVYLIPLVVVIGVVCYILQIPVVSYVLTISDWLEGSLKIINMYLLYSLGIHTGIIVVLKSIRSVLHV